MIEIRDVPESDVGRMVVVPVADKDEIDPAERLGSRQILRAARITEPRIGQDSLP